MVVFEDGIQVESFENVVILQPCKRVETEYFGNDLVDTKMANAIGEKRTSRRTGSLVLQITARIALLCSFTSSSKETNACTATSTLISQRPILHPSIPSFAICAFLIDA